MSPFVNKDSGGQDETGPQGEGLHVDVDDKACVDCRRDVPAWVRTCPGCGGDVVPRADLPAPHDSILQRFLDEDDEDEPSAAPDVAVEDDRGGEGDGPAAP